MRAPPDPHTIDDYRALTAAIAVLSPTNDPVTGTLVMGNTIQNEVYGIGVFNASKSTIMGNTASSSVKVLLFGAVENQTAVSTLSDQISTVQASQSALQNSLASLQNHEGGTTV